jgi:hypothetical protein
VSKRGQRSSLELLKDFRSLSGTERPDSKQKGYRYTFLRTTHVGTNELYVIIIVASVRRWFSYKGPFTKMARPSFDDGRSEDLTTNRFLEEDPPSHPSPSTTYQVRLISYREKVPNSTTLFNMPVYNFKKLGAIPSASDLIDIVLTRTQRRTPTVVHPGYKITRIRSF